MAGIKRARDIKVTEVLPIKTTPGGNSFLECQTDVGLVAFWGKSGNMRNIEAIGQHKPPFTVHCDCIDPNKSVFPAHDVWVPEKSALSFVE